MIVIKHEKKYTNDSRIYISYYKDGYLGFLTYSDIENARKYKSLQCAKKDFIKHRFNPETHKYISI